MADLVSDRILAGWRKRCREKLANNPRSMASTHAATMASIIARLDAAEQRATALAAVADAVAALKLRDGYTEGTMGFILIEVERKSWLTLKAAHDAAAAIRQDPPAEPNLADMRPNASGFCDP